MLSAEDYDALADFVRSLVHRIAAFPASGHVAVKDRVIAMFQTRTQAAIKRGFQARHPEMALARMLGDLA